MPLASSFFTFFSRGGREDKKKKKKTRLIEVFGPLLKCPLFAPLLQGRPQEVSEILVSRCA